MPKVENRGAHLRAGAVAKESKGPYVPTGKPRGRKKKEGSKVPYVPTGIPRGRKKMDPSQLKPQKVYVPKKYNTNSRKVENRGVHLRAGAVAKEPKGPYVPTGKPRGRPKKEEESD